MQCGCAVHKPPKADKLTIKKKCEVYIVYRDKIKVFYKSAQEAQSEGYEYSEKEVNQKMGILNFIEGIRSDAKRFYKRVSSEKLANVHYIKDESKEYQDIVKQADYVSTYLFITNMIVRLGKRLQLKLYSHLRLGWLGN